LSSRLIFGSAIVLSTFFVTGCKNSNLGVAIPKDAPLVKMSTVIANPTDYHGKKILMKGIVSSQCPSLCEFVFKDGMNNTTIFPQGFKIPKIETGKKVSVYAQVTKGQEQVVFSAIGLKLE
jgi:hypothetical protein